MGLHVSIAQQLLVIDRAMRIIQCATHSTQVFNYLKYLLKLVIGNQNLYIRILYVITFITFWSDIETVYSTATVCDRPSDENPTVGYPLDPFRSR